MATKCNLLILTTILWIPFIIVFSADMCISGDRIWSEEPSPHWPFHTKIHRDDLLRTKMNVYSSLCYSWAILILVFQIFHHQKSAMEPSILCWLWMNCIGSTSLSIYSSLFHAAATREFNAGDVAFMFMLSGSGIPLLVFAVTPRALYRIVFTLCYNLFIPIWTVYPGWPGFTASRMVAILALCSMIAIFIYYKTCALSMKAPVLSLICLLVASVCKYMDQPLGIYCEGTAFFHFGSAIAAAPILVDMSGTSSSQGTDSIEREEAAKEPRQTAVQMHSESQIGP